MVAQFLKKKSKRISTRKRTKIEKKVREHNRKLKKESKKNPKKRSRKDPGIPNSVPFKEELLKEAVEEKRLVDELKEKTRQKKKKEQKKKRRQLMDRGRNLEAVVKDAQTRTAQYEHKMAINKNTLNDGKKSVENSLKQYYKEFRKVVDNADVILQVLDARDPLGSRCPQVEQAVLNSGTRKRLVLVLNKIDLVPKSNVEDWLKYLRNEFPTVPFKASTQSQKDHLARSNVPLALASDQLRKSSQCLGAEFVMKLLGNYCRNQDIKTSITVGVVGFPNTGKSSIINSLKRSRACQVGATPGVTKSMQEVHLDKHIKLLDSPGIVMPTGMSDAAIILRNCVKVETLQDPVAPVEAILRRCNKHQIMLHYNVPSYADANEFLSILAKRLGKIKKGGLPDINKAARSVLQDWNLGRITYFTMPPENTTSHVHTEFVQEMTKEFDIEALMAEEEDTLKNLNHDMKDHVVVKSVGPTTGMVEDEEEMQDTEEGEGENEENMEDEEVDNNELKATTISFKKLKPKATKTEIARKKKQRNDPDVRVEENQQQQKQMKKEYKKLQKRKKKADVLAGTLASALDGAMNFGIGSTGESDAYDFATDFK